MTWSLEAARAGFDRHAGEWDALNREHGNHILLDSRFVGALVRCFASPAILLARSTAPNARGVALVERGPLGFASTFQPSQSPLGLILLESPDGAVAQARDLMRRLPGYVVGFSVLQQDPDGTLFPAEFHDGMSERVEYIETGRLRLEGTHEEYWMRRSKNLKHNLGRQRRRLAEEGRSLVLRTIRDPAQVGACVATYGRLEGSGWKASTGTAVSADNDQGAFYRDVLETFLARDEGCVFQLELDDRVIASDLCLERNGVLVILKTAYDASIEGLSPGLLLHQEIFAQLYAGGRVRSVEFYGRVREWHTKWTQDFRRMYHVNLYRNRWARQARAIVRRGMGLLQPGPRGAADPPPSGS